MNSTAPHNSLSLPFSNALAPCILFWMGACGRTVRMRPCNRICQAITKRRTRGIMSSLEELLARGLFSQELVPPLSPRRALPCSDQCVGTRTAARLSCIFMLYNFSLSFAPRAFASVDHVLRRDRYMTKRLITVYPNSEPGQIHNHGIFGNQDRTRQRGVRS